MNYRILLFDLDDTLIDNKQSVKCALESTLNHFGYEYSEEIFLKWLKIDKDFWERWQNGLVELPAKYKKETGKKSQEFLDWLRSQRFLIFLNDSISLDNAIILNNYYMSLLSKNVIPVEGAKDVLEYLSGGYSIIVATNGPKVAARDKIIRIGCTKFVDNVFSADMFGYMKPRKEFLDGIMGAIGNINKREYLVIGDSLKSDVGLAENCGVDSCWFNRAKSRAFLENYRPTMIIERLEQLKSLLG